MAGRNVTTCHRLAGPSSPAAASEPPTLPAAPSRVVPTGAHQQADRSGESAARERIPLREGDEQGGVRGEWHGRSAAPLGSGYCGNAQR